MKILNKEELAALTAEEREQYLRDLRSLREREVRELETLRTHEIEDAEAQLQDIQAQERQRLDEEIVQLMRQETAGPFPAQRQTADLEGIAAAEEAPALPGGDVEYDIPARVTPQDAEALYDRLGSLAERQEYLMQKGGMTDRDKTEAQKLEEEIAKIRGYAITDSRVRNRLDQVVENMYDIEHE